MLEPSTAIQRVRDDANFPSSGFPTDDDIIRWLNEGYLNFYSHMNKHVRTWNIYTYNAQRDSTTREVDVPVDFGGYVTRAEYDNGSGRPDTLNLTTRSHFDFTTAAIPRRFAVQRRKFLLDPQPSVSDSENTLRFLYLRSPLKVHYGSIQSGTSTQVTLASSAVAGTVGRRDSIHVNQVIRIVNGAAVGEERVIDGYTGTSKVATVDEAFDVVPSTGDKYQIMMDLHHDDEEAVIAYAKMRAFDKDEMPDSVWREQWRTGQRQAVEREVERGYGKYRERNERAFGRRYYG